MRALTVAVITLAACTGEPDDVIDYSEYAPFDTANLAPQLARLASHATIATLRTEADLVNHAEVFGDIGDEYQDNDLQAKVAGRTDDHLELDGYGVEGIGAFLDDNISEAIAMGLDATTEAELEWAGQTVDKGLLVFFYFSVYHELAERHRGNLDEGFGYWGLETDGTPWAGLAAVAEGREDEFGVTLNSTVFRSFIEARYAMAAGTVSSDDALPEDAGYDAAMAAIDAEMLRTMSYYAIHELDELDAGNADVKLIEARVIWEGVRPYAEHADPPVSAAIMAGLYPAGVPSRDASGYFWSGLDDVRDGTTTVAPAAIRADIGTIVQSLE